MDSVMQAAAQFPALAACVALLTWVAIAWAQRH